MDSATDSLPHRFGISRHYPQLLIPHNPISSAMDELYGQQLASTLTHGLDPLNILPSAATGSVAGNQPTADISISVASVQVNASTNQSNDANEDSDDDEEMSIKSEINSEDECLSDSDSQPDVDVKEEADETQTETEINQTGDTATVKEEIVSSSECSSDSDSDDYESDTVQVKEEEQEDEIRFVRTSHNQDFVPDGASIEESGNIAQSNGNAETVNPCESNNEHQSDGMMMDDEENVDEESQDEPSITVVNYEVEMQSLDMSNNQDSAPDGASIEESGNIAQSNGNAETVNSNEGDNEEQSDEMLMDDGENVDEESQNEPTIIAVNYEEFEAQIIDNSHNQDSVPDGSSVEESENISQQDGNVETVGSHMTDSNESKNEHSSGQEMLDGEENNTEANSVPGHAGPSIVSNSASTLTRRSARASASRTVNYAEGMENSWLDQDGTWSGTRQSKRKTGRSGKSNAPKRSRVDPAPTVAAAEVEDTSEEEDDSEPEDFSLRVIVGRLNCRAPGCKKVFPSKVQLDGHLLTKHAIEKYACIVKDCTESYATSDELTTHRNSAHDNLDNDWPCGQCEVTCNTYHNLWNHIYQYHETGLFACSSDKCDFTEKTRIKVHNHQHKHRAAEHRCTYVGCSVSFKKKSELTRHFRVHSKEKPFLCSQCTKAFAQKIHLTAHERVHSGLKPYSCTWPHCNFSSCGQSAVIAHIRGVHFGLPKTVKMQREKGIIDNRDARLFLKKTSTNGN